jgi:hypothetical protein
MGQNSQDIAYNFGQMGSVYCAKANVVVPPRDMVIVAIQFLADNALTVLTPESLDGRGPNFPMINDADNADLDADTNDFNANGVVTLDLTDNAGSNLFTVALSGGANDKVQAGQFVLLVNDTAETDGDPATVIDAQTPTPIYNGPNARGVKVKKVDGANVTLEGHGVTRSSFVGISPDSQSLIFLDDTHGAGGMSSATSLTFPAGMTIYGRWTAVKPTAQSHTTVAGGIICYFGY